MENKFSNFQNLGEEIIPSPTIDLSNQVILHIPNRFVQSKLNSINQSDQDNQENINKSTSLNQIKSTYENEKISKPNKSNSLIQNLDNIVLELDETTKDKIIKVLNDCSKLLKFNSIKYFKEKILNEISDLIFYLIDIKIKDENLNNSKIEFNYVKRDEILLKLIDNRFIISNYEKFSNELIFKIINENEKLIDDLNDLDELSSTDSDATLISTWSDDKDNLFKENRNSLTKKYYEIDNQEDNKNNENKLSEINKANKQLNNKIKIKLSDNNNSNDQNETNRISGNILFILHKF